MSEIDVTPLKRAVQRLDEGLAMLGAEPLNTLLRDGVIQRFEFTYELSHKMLRRFLEAGAASPEEISRLSFPNLIRVGSEQGLVPSSWHEWKDYRQARIDANHVCNEVEARKVLEIVPSFAAEARSLALGLESHGAQAGQCRPDRLGP